MACTKRHTAARMTALLTKRGRIIDNNVTVVQVTIYRCGCTRQQIVGMMITDEQLAAIDRRFD